MNVDNGLTFNKNSNKCTFAFAFFSNRYFRIFTDNLPTHSTPLCFLCRSASAIRKQNAAAAVVQ